MSEKKERGNREWVKTLAIVFLAIMLVLTLFSNTIMNYSLPEVKTATVYPGTITATVRGTGTVLAKDPYYIKATESRKIISVAVLNGEYVEKGTPLFYFDEKESEEISIAKEAVSAAEEELEQLEIAYKKSFLTGTNTEALVDAKDGTIETEAELEARVNEALNQKLAVEAEKERLENLLPALNRQLEILNAQGEDGGLADAETALTEATALLVTATAEKDAAQAIIDEPTSSSEEIEEAEEKLTDANNEIDSLNAEISTLQEKIDGLEETPQTERVANITNQISQITYEISMEDSKLTQIQEVLDEIGEKYTIEEAQQGIDKQKQKVLEAKAELEEIIEASKGSVITAPVTGTVTNILVAAGDTTVPEAELATIQIDGKGYTLEFSVTKQQAQKLNIGDEAELVNNWYYSDVKVVLANTKADPTSPTKNTVLVFDIVGEELLGGESITVSIGGRSANYDLVVPNSAIHEDNEGKFILTVESKQSPLGNRYIARRENVEVLAADDTQSAIKAALYGYEYVITTSSLPVEAGNQVRIIEN